MQKQFYLNEFLPPNNMGKLEDEFEEEIPISVLNISKTIHNNSGGSDGKSDKSSSSGGSRRSPDADSRYAVQRFLKPLRLVGPIFAP